MDDQALEFFAWGVSCWVCAGSNFAPEAYIALYQACRVEGDFQKGRRIMSAMLPLMRVLEQDGKFILMANIRPLPPDRGTAAWDALLPPRQAYPELTDARQADYLVIGAGFAGLSAARRLRQLQPTARIVVLEVRQVAQGPAGRNSGFMIDLPHNLSSEDYAGTSADNDRRQTALNRAAIRFAQEATQEYAMPNDAV